MSTLPTTPTEPPPSRWQFPPPDNPGQDDLIAVGADLVPGTLLAAYRAGYFPMPLSGTTDGGAEGIGWWSPDPRAIIELDQFEPSRSLRRSMGRYAIRVDSDFEAVLSACADPARPHGWIDGSIRQAYSELHSLGWVHSIEAWDDDGLAGGLYGVALGNFFAGESMFAARRDASKVALVALVEILRSNPGGLLDVQWSTDHLVSLGALDIDRTTYLERLSRSAALAGPVWSIP